MYPLAPAVKVLSRLVFPGLCLVLASARIHASPIAFPSGFVPLTSIESTSPAPSGVRLILGYSTFPAFATIRSLPLPSTTGEQFSEASIQLAPGQFFSNVYVPTNAERFGDFRDFDGVVLDPLSGQPFPGNIIPTSVLGGIYAFRVGPAAPAPEPSSLYEIGWGAAVILVALRIRKPATPLANR